MKTDYFPPPRKIRAVRTQPPRYDYPYLVRAQTAAREEVFVGLDVWSWWALGVFVGVFIMIGVSI